MKKTIECYVISFDRNRGEGMIRAVYGNGLNWGTIYACNIPGKKTWYPETACVYYGVGQVIEVCVDDNFNIPVTRGEFDAEKWAGLDQSRLAFKCNDDGKAINGLFA